MSQDEKTFRIYVDVKVRRLKDTDEIGRPLEMPTIDQIKIRCSPILIDTRCFNEEEYAFSYGPQTVEELCGWEKL